MQKGVSSRDRSEPVAGRLEQPPSTTWWWWELHGPTGCVCTNWACWLSTPIPRPPAPALGLPGLLRPTASGPRGTPGTSAFSALLMSSGCLLRPSLLARPPGNTPSEWWGARGHPGEAENRKQRQHVHRCVPTSRERCTPLCSGVGGGRNEVKALCHQFYKLGTLNLQYKGAPSMYWLTGLHFFSTIYLKLRILVSGQDWMTDVQQALSLCKGAKTTAPGSLQLD